MSETHTTLKPKTNIILSVVWGLAILTILYFSRPTPIIFFLLGGFLGGLGGIMQILSIKESKNAIISASSMLEVRKALASTRWGKRYIRFLWISNIGFIVLALYFQVNLIFNVLAAYCSFCFIREIVTLKTIFELQRIANR
jgi:hypothetical protein